MLHVTSPVRFLGMVLHPRREIAGPVQQILAWAEHHHVTVLGLHDEIARLDCRAIPVSEPEMADRADLLVALGGDGTVLRAMRLAGGPRVPVLGVNLGKLGFLAEVDVGDLASALTAITDHGFVVEARAALDVVIGEQRFSAFNDVVVVRVPGEGAADVELAVQGEYFVSYAADAVIVATPTGSTAYNFSAGGPIIDPSVGAIVVTPSSSHSVFNRSIIVDPSQHLTLTVMSSAGRLAVEVDGPVATHVVAGDTLTVTSRADAARVVRLGTTTFYERTRRKLGITGPTELSSPPRGREVP
ncbi:MAG: NAD(+)/NADH kinase [Acidimicrobiaceae bacterium]|nr:NAD(+)/NADH kinase [Acidimicrobiaceae bacterium]